MIIINLSHRNGKLPFKRGYGPFDKNEVTCKIVYMELSKIFVFYITVIRQNSLDRLGINKGNIQDVSKLGIQG